MEGKSLNQYIEEAIAQYTVEKMKKYAELTDDIEPKLDEADKEADSRCQVYTRPGIF